MCAGFANRRCHFERARACCRAMFRHTMNPDKLRPYVPPHCRSKQSRINAHHSFIRHEGSRAAFIDRRLAELYPNTPIPLQHTDAYSLLVAVVLSAQCTDLRVNKITPILWARAQTPESMSEVPVCEVEAIIRPCGLAPQKARAIVGLSRLLVERHGGQVPRSFANSRNCLALGTKPCGDHGEIFGEPRVSSGHPHPPACQALAI